MQSNFTALRILWVPPVDSSPHPQTLVATELLTVSKGFPFPEGRRVGIVEHVAFSDRLLSLSHVYFRFRHVFLWLDGAFLALNNILLFGWASVSFSIHPLTDLLLCCS